MVIIWRGLGLLVPVIYALAYVILTYLIWSFDFDINRDIANPKFLWYWAALGGLTTWFFGQNINSPRTEAAGQTVKNRHTLFFIPVQFWAFVVAGFVFFMQSTALKRFAYVNTIYEQSRTEFIAKKQRLLDLSENPKTGDYYFFDVDSEDWDGSTKGKQPWRSVKKLAFRLVDANETTLLLLHPTVQKNSIYPHEDPMLYFQDSVSGERVLTKIRRTVVRDAISTNFQKSRHFSGCAIPELDLTGNLTARLTEINRK